VGEVLVLKHVLGVGKRHLAERSSAVDVAEAVGGADVVDRAEQFFPRRRRSCGGSATRDD